MRFIIALAIAVLATPLEAQTGDLPRDAFRDPEAEELVRLARVRRAIVDTRITAYETTSRERMSARMSIAGFDRLIFRRETVTQIHWTRDTVRVELIGAREVQPMIRAMPTLPPANVAGWMPVIAFDPVDSEMLLRLDSTEIIHPFAPESERYYRFSSGETTSIRLGDGREVRLRELRIAARRPDPRLIDGSFWLDSESYAVVRAGFRAQRSTSEGGVSVLSPEVGGEVDIAVDYGLWDLQWWLPRTMVALGTVRVSGMRLPLSYERSYADYRVEGNPVPLASAIGETTERPCRPQIFMSIEVGIGDLPADSLWDRRWESSIASVAETDSASLERGRRCDRAFLVSAAEDIDLVSAEVFTASIYDDSEAVAGEEEMRRVLELLQRIPQPPLTMGTPSLQLLPLDLFRYNRVEVLSGGARAALPFGAVGLAGELRIGTTGEVGARVGMTRSARSLSTELAAYRGIEAVEVAAQPFSLPASVAAFALGRDENDYFRGTGFEFRATPGALQREGWDFRLYAERQASVATRSDFSLRGVLDGGFDLRPNLEAEELDQVGAALRLRTALGGDDPSRPRAGVELELHGEVGDRTFTRPSVRFEGSVPFLSRFGLGLGVATGSAFGEVPTQRLWQVGGAGTVRGHDPASLRGDTFWRARTELFRGGPTLRLGVFGDAGWAGEREHLFQEPILKGVGVGASLLDNLVRIDLARGIGGEGFRMHLRLGGGL